MENYCNIGACEKSDFALKTISVILTENALIDQNFKCKKVEYTSD